MTTPRAVLMAELVMSADRLITTARAAQPVPGEWPPHVVLGHVALNDAENWSPRVALMVNAAKSGETAPVFAWFEPDGDEVGARFADASIDETAAALMASRTGLLAQLRDLAPEDWDAQAHHEVFGVLDVRDLMLRLLAHDEGHRGELLLGPDVSLDL